MFIAVLNKCDEEHDHCAVNELKEDAYYCSEDDVHCLAGMILRSSNKWVEGKASVVLGSNPPEVCKGVGGAFETARIYVNAGKCTHAMCTQAKHEAANQLRSRVPTDCKKYVKESPQPCKYGPGCK